MQSKQPTTLLIEQRLNDNQSISSIAREFGLSRTRIQQIRKQMVRGGCMQPLAPLQPPSDGQVLSFSFMKSLTIRVTTPVFDALTEACAITNRKDPEEPITVEEYVEECATTRLVELGLLRKNRRK